eukprot:g33005.t1
MLKFLKMTVAEDAITTGDILEVLVAEEVLLQEEKEISLQDVKADLEAIEVQHHAKAVLAAEVQRLQEQAVSQDPQKLPDEMEVLQKDLQDVLKALATHQEKEDQEEVNTFC